MINNSNISMVLKTVEHMISDVPYVSLLKDPFRILVGTVLSARTRDETTAIVTEQLFRQISTPIELAALSTNKLEQIVYKTGFYKTKARHLKQLSEQLIQEHNGNVPNTIDELVKLPGVGRKTANLVVITAFGKPGVCVDTHVHRITNRWGYVMTKSADRTEMALRAKLSEKHWNTINWLLVQFGKQICKPIIPLCSVCKLNKICPKIDVLENEKLL